MPQFRKKPVVIEAIQYEGSSSSARAVIDFCRGSSTPAMIDTEIRNCSPANPEGFEYPALKIATLEGDMIVSAHDWVIRGVSGEHYPCKPEIFAASYSPASDAATPHQDALSAWVVEHAARMGIPAEDWAAAILDDIRSKQA